MNILQHISNKVNGNAREIPQNYDTTRIENRGDDVLIYSSQILEVMESTEYMFGKRHWYMFDGPITHRAKTYSWFLPELIFMLEALVERKVANPLYATLAIIDAIKLDTWVGKTRAYERIDYRKVSKTLVYNPLPHQRNYMEHYEYSTSKHELRGGLSAMAPGTGKALANGEPVLTPTGWKAIESLVIGDEVINSEGKISLVTGVFPQGFRELYRIKFSDGTHSDCDGDHIWKVNNVLMTTLEMLDTGITDVNDEAIYTVPRFGGVICSSRADVDYDPHTMGVLHLNSTSRIARITDDYLRGSETQRADLYTGLTGKSHRTDTTAFKTLSEDLAIAMADLARGLGKTVYKGTYKDRDYLTQHVVRQLPDVKKIVRITPLGEGKATCISVDAADSLFLTRGYTLTHNTYTSMAIAEGLNMERIIVVCPKPVIHDPWIKSTTDLYRNKRHTVWSVNSKRKPHQDDKYLICNYAYMHKLHEQIKRFKKKPTMVIVDESHNLNEMSSAQTRTYIELAKTYGDDIIHLSGTALKARIEELIPLMTVIDDRFTDDVAKRFSKVLKYSPVEDVLDMIHNRMNRMSMTVEKSALKLVDPITVTHPIKLINGERYTVTNVKKEMKIYAAKRIVVHNEYRPTAVKIYWELVDSLDHQTDTYRAFKRDWKRIYAADAYFDLHEEMKAVNGYENSNILPRLNNEDRKEFRRIRAIAKYPKLKTLGETLGNVLGKMRIECNVDIAKALNYKTLFGEAVGKCLFFSNHVAAINTMAIKSAKRGYQPLVVYGEHVNDLPEIVDKFENTDANPLGATYASLSTGVPLTMVTDVYILDSPFRDYVLTQAIARAHRLGNDKQVYVHFILLKTSEPNINDRSLDLAEFSGQVVADILDVDPTVDYPEGINEEITE